MSDSSERRIEEILARIEFPGEDAESLRAYLQQRRFAERVMARIRALHYRARKALAWGSFCVVNLVLLALFGTNQPFLADFFALQAELAQFFFLFLGLTFVGSLVGLVLSLDTSWFEHLRHRNV